MSISTALEARRDALREREAGFTLIELLVVVIIIGILAAIAIPIYLGVTNGAKDSGVKSDLSVDKTAITGFAVDNNGIVPATITNYDKGTPTGGTVNDDLSKYGWSKSPNTTTLAYTTNGSGTATTWCLDGTSATGKQFRVSLNTAVAAGTCAQLTTANY